MDMWMDVRIARKWPAAVNVVALELVADPPEELPPFEAGSCINIRIPGGMLRPYSLCNAAHSARHYLIAVRHEPRGRGASAYLCDTAQVGDTLRISHSLNTFALNRSAVYSVLLAGGIGITPLLSMAEDLWHRGAGFELHYCARSASHAAFAGLLRDSPYRHQVHFHWSEMQPGRMDFSASFSKIPRLSHIYACGPASFMQAAMGAASQLGWANERLHFESFS